MSDEVLEGVVRIYNRSDKMVNELIYGTRVIVPPRGSVETSARRAKEMIERHPGVLTQDASFAKHAVYGEKELQIIELLDEVHLRKCLRVLMCGGIADVAVALEDQKKQNKK